MLNKFFRNFILLLMVWLMPYHESNHIWAQKNVQVYNIQFVEISKNQATNSSNNGNKTKIYMQRNLFLYPLDTFFVIYDTIVDIKFEVDEGMFIPGPRMIYKKAITVYDVKRKLLYDLVNSVCYRFNFKEIPEFIVNPIAHHRKEITFKGDSDVKMYFKRSNNTTHYPFFYELFPGYLLEKYESNKITMQLKSFTKSHFYLSQPQIQNIHQRILKISCENPQVIRFENYILGVE